VTARKVQRLVFGRGTWNHGLIVGRTGSGKSNLMHVVVTAGALGYSPEELRMYLIDLKTVEFTSYRRLPHAEVVAIDADREFALTVVEDVDEEMRKRMEDFRRVGANDLAEYREKTGKPVPRVLLLIDEFQVLFEQVDTVAQEAGRLLDRLVRQGRAFGIHALLGSQSLAGHSLPRTSMDQMAVRIALQCSEADSRLVLADDNPAARRLSRPGQAIYNSANGLIEGNAEFQVALFDERDQERYGAAIAELARQHGVDRGPLVFEGNEPARLEACAPLRERLHSGPLASLRSVESWIGEPVSARRPLTVRWTRRSGSHLLVVGREEEEGVGVLLSVVLSLCIQYPAERLRVYVVDFSTPEAEWAGLGDAVQGRFPGQVRVLGRHELLGALADLDRMLQSSIQQGTAIRQDHYLVLVGLHRMRDLRAPEDSDLRWDREATEPTPTDRLRRLVRDGPEVGMHVLAWCDAVGTLRRSLDRRTIREFGYRVAGAMGEQDSLELLDQADAARLTKAHRMIFYDEERPGALVKFRPYVVRSVDWVTRGDQGTQ